MSYPGLMPSEPANEPSWLYVAGTWTRFQPPAEITLWSEEDDLPPEWNLYTKMGRPCQSGGLYSEVTILDKRSATEPVLFCILLSTGFECCDTVFCKGLPDLFALWALLGLSFFATPKTIPASPGWMADQTFPARGPLQAGRMHGRVLALQIDSQLESVEAVIENKGLAVHLDRPRFFWAGEE